MDSLAGLRIGAYARFSSDNQRDRSIEDQIRVCREFVEKNNGRIGDDLVFTDYAVSGASNTRAGFESLLRRIESKAVEVIVVESQDRLTRDLGDADKFWKLCQFNNVRVICVSDGIDSLHRGSRLQFGVKALIADEYLADLREKTYRGLRGAAIKGLSTGGLPYGYTSRAIWNGGREPEGYEILVHAEQASVVVRVFTMYAEGYSYLTIAKALNDDHVPPPRSHSRRHPSKFWKKGTVREMLSNPAYIGKWSFGRKQWRKDPHTRKRRYIKRAPNEVFVEDRPHLRIVSDAVWESVRTRRQAVRENYAGQGEGAPGHRTAHPFAGLLFCGVCGHRMVDGGGSSARAYRCSASATGGICSNRGRLREDVLLEAAIAELKRVLFQTDLRERIAEKIRARLATFRSRSNSERRRLDKEAGRLDGEIDRLVTFIRSTDPTASPGAFEAVRASLEKATAERRSVQAKLDALKDSTNEPRVPTEDEILAYLRDVEGRLRDDPTGAREALRKLLLDGRIVMHPESDGAWRAESAIIVGRLAGNSRKPRSGGLAGASGISATEVVEIGSCAGRI